METASNGLQREKWFSDFLDHSIDSGIAQTFEHGYHPYPEVPSHELYRQGNGWPINCTASVNDGKIVYYTVSLPVSKTERCRIAIDKDEEWANCEDYFLKRRIRQNLFSSLLNKQLLDQLQSACDYWTSRKPAAGRWNDSLARDSHGQICSYVCVLRSGGKLTANLDAKGEISSVYVDDRSDAIWDLAIKDSAMNREQLTHFRW